MNMINFKDCTDQELVILFHLLNQSTKQFIDNLSFEFDTQFAKDRLLHIHSNTALPMWETCENEVNNRGIDISSLTISKRI